ncbi:MAG: long-chain fatty acid--CoA ligase [Spirochaetes bacterium]|nr:long-chain fatty acid--CoA ligase [Spirochaetota bacterium]
MNPLAHIITEVPCKTINELWHERAKAHADKTYLYWQDKAHSYAAFDALTSKAAGMLHALGAHKGDHIAVLIPNSLEFLEAWFGSMKGGFTAVTINTLLKAEELEYILNDSDAEILVTTPTFRKALEAVWPRLTKLKTVVLTEADAHYPDAKILRTEIEKAERFDAKDLKGSDYASMIYTSGTTGHPKGVLLTHANILYNSFVAHQMIDLAENDTALCIMPLFHVNAQIASMMATLWAGATVVLEEGFKPRGFIDTLKKYRCTTFSGVPTIYNFLNELKDADGADLSFLKACVCGAAPMPVEVFNKFEEKFKAKIIEGYGLSEGTCVSSLNPLHGTRKIGSIGVAIPGQEMAIVAIRGGEVAAATDGNAAIVNPNINDKNIFLKDGEIGEIVIKGPNMMNGYYKKPEANRQTLVDGWLHTGDLGQRDSDGYFYITGRKKEMIIQGGENIYPKEIEEALYKHEAVSECAIVGIPDKSYGEVVGAFIIPKEGVALEAKDIRAFLREKIANYKMPKVIEFVAAFPKTATGKIQKNKIVENYGSR